MKKNKFVEGTIFAYAIILITKVIGALYVIPFKRIIGAEGGVLYSYAYSVYNLFLDISTSGIPTAISMIISEYNALKMFNEREFAFKVAKKLTSIISILAFLAMFLLARPIASFFVTDIDSANSIPDIVLVIRVISFCILIIPFLSITRGYLQGNKYVSSSSTSQLIEQLVRVFIALAGSYIAINVLNKEVSTGVGVALSGTVIGGLCAYLFLKAKIHKNRELFKEGVTNINDSKVSTKEVIKKIATRAIPVIIIAATQNIYGIVDLKLLIKGLYMIGYGSELSQEIGSIAITWAPKICMIINSIAVGMCLSIIPFIVDSFVKNDKKELNDKYNQAMNTILYVSVPLAVFMVFFGSEIYRIFYGFNNYGGIILGANAIVSILFSLQMVMDMMLQGIKNYKLVFINTFLGLFLNAALDVPMILLLHKVGLNPVIGSIVASFIGQSVSIAIIMIGTRKKYQFSFKNVFVVLTQILLSCVIMSGIIILLKQLMPAETTYFQAFGLLALFGIISMGIYLLLTYKIGTFKKVLGDDFLSGIINRFKKNKTSN